VRADVPDESSGTDPAQGTGILGFHQYNGEMTMRLSDERLEEIRTWLGGGGGQDPAIKQEELSAMANELRQLRLRTSTTSRSAGVKGAPGH
jgi:hypothetical protein